MNASLKLLWRDIRSGELNILIFSLLLATATVTAISLFTSRIQNSILDEATEFLAADAQIRSTLPLEQHWVQTAQEQGLKTATVATFRAMVFSDSNMQLVAVKAVTEAYPLKGAVTLSDQPFVNGQPINHGPEAGEVWLASRLFAALDIAIGDSVSIGDADFTVTRVLIKEPDAPQTFFGVAPRAIINQADVAATSAVQTGSRVNYALLIAGEKAALQKMHEQLEPLGNHARWIGVHDGNRNIGDALKRAEKFLLLAGSLSVLLSGVAIALAARRYALRQAASVALLKTFGHTPADITRHYSVVLLLLGVISVALGTAAGWGLHTFILALLAGLLPNGLSLPNASAFATGAASGFITLLAFAAPPLLSLRKVAPAAVLRQDAHTGLLHPGIAAAIGFTAITLLIFAYSQSLSLTAIIALGGVITLAGGVLLAGLVLWLTQKTGRYLSHTWRLGFANLQRHRGFNTVQIVIFAALIMLLLILADTRSSLISQWQQQLPDNTPNHFIFNIFEAEKAQVENLLEEQGIEHRPFYPMMRGRIVEVNGESVTPRIENTRSHMNYERELNLTWATQLGEDNKILHGNWHGETTPELTVSAEQDYAEGIGLDVGDQLTFSIAGQQVTATLGSIRSVAWDSMNPNFFMIFNQPLLDNTATNWLTSLYLPADKKNVLNQLGRQIPTASVVELDQMIAQVQNIVGQVTLAVEFILVLVLAAGILVLITSIQATLDLRFQESAILRTLGARRQLVNRILLIEFSSLGLMAGLLGAAGAQCSLYFLQTRLFNLDFSPSPFILVAGPLLGAVLIGTIGWVSTRRVTLEPPLTVLRNL